MSESTPPGPDASPDEIEADIVETRARLADSVDALADKVNVKARAQEKVEEAKSTAQAKVDDVKTQAKAKVADVRSAAQAKVTQGREKLTQGSQQVEQRVLGLPRPAQVALAAAPVLVAGLLVARQVRSHRPAVTTAPAAGRLRGRTRAVPVVPVVVPTVRTVRTRRRGAKA